MTSSGFTRRFTALLRKEVRQLLRDSSNLAVGLLLPGVLILLFGYGLSFDVTHAPVAVAMEDSSPTARDVLSGLAGSPYLVPLWVDSMAEAERQMRAGKVNAIVRVPADFSRQLAAGQARIQLILNGADSNTANAVNGYVGGAVATWFQHQADRGGGKTAVRGVVVEQRTWFNEASDSTWYLVPGLIVLIMTLTGAFLTSMLIAREWERGTLEALFVTPVRPIEMVLAKLAPYFVLGAIDLACASWPRSSCSTCRCAARSRHRRCVAALPPVVALARTVHLGDDAQPVPGQPGRAARQLHAGADALGLRLRPAQRPAPDPGRQPVAAGDALHGPDQDPVPCRRQLGPRAATAHPGALCAVLISPRAGRLRKKLD